MQGVVIRRAHCPAKLYRHHIPSSCPAAARVSRSLRYRAGGLERCSAAAGRRARSVAVRATGGPGTGDDEQAAPPPRQDVVVDAGGGASSGGAKRGTVAGAVALIVGTSIGSGILAVPQSTAPAGFVPSAVCMVTCWAFLVTEALLLAEINVHLRRKQKKDGDSGSTGLEVISLKSMAQETLGEWGGNLAATAYLFLSYTSMVAYTSKSGEVLSRVIGSVPEPVSGGAFTAAVALLIAGGGTGVTAQVNQLLTFFMIGLLLTIEVSAVALGGGLGLPANTHWEQVPATLPVIIFTLVYHDIAPVICAYLEGDLARIRLSILVGSLVPLLSLLVWDDIALGLSTTDLHGFNILDMLKTEWGYTVVETFSLLAVGTSLIGTLLGASQFFVEQMTNLAAASPDEETITGDVSVEDGSRSSRLGWKTLLERNRLGYVATGVVVVPTMLIAAAVPDSFSIATDIAGGYCMTILYGVLPPLMAWSIGSKLSDPKSGFVEAVETSTDVKEKASFTSTKPVLVGMGVFSVLMVFQQIFQDFVSFNTYLLSWAS
uniref:Uncharacterized protein n=1 Tax=Avena sativa TaxID=4498 RepID=A0ACD5TW42_AVESA